MSEINGRYKQIIEDIENNIKDQETLDFVKDKFAEVSMLFIDMLDRVTRLTDSKIQEIETRQQEITNRINSVQTIVDGIESDIYEDDENYEFEIVCPYCNYEFTADIEDESKDEIQCPECHNTIELDWNLEEDFGGCSASCSHCDAGCGVAEEEEEYHLEDIDLTSRAKKDDKNKKTNKNRKENDDNEDDEDM